MAIPQLAGNTIAPAQTTAGTIGAGVVQGGSAGDATGGSIQPDASQISPLATNLNELQAAPQNNPDIPPPPPPPPVPGSANQPAGTPDSVIPPPPPPQLSQPGVPNPKGGANQGNMPPPPPSPNGPGTVDANGVTYNWGAPQAGGIQQATDMNGNTYTFDPAKGTITDMQTGQAYPVLSETEMENGVKTPLSNFSYGNADAKGNIKIVSSSGDTYTYHPGTPGTSVLGMITEDGTGQMFPVVSTKNQDTLQDLIEAWGPLVGNQYAFTDQYGNEPWATYHQ